MTDEDDEFVRIEKESLWRKRQTEEHLGQPVYFKPKKEWVGLTEEDFVCINSLCDTPIQAAEYAEFLLKEKNHA